MSALSTGIAAWSSCPCGAAPVRAGVLLWLAPSLPRIRYKVHHARLLAGENGRKFALHAKNVPKRAILGEQGEFCTAHAVRRGVLGEFCTGSGAVRLVQGESCTASGPARFLVGECCVASTPSESPVAGLPLPTGIAAWSSCPSGALRADGGGGFALHEAIWGRVIGVSDPHVVRFPRLVVSKL